MGLMIGSFQKCSNSILNLWCLVKKKVWLPSFLSFKGYWTSFRILCDVYCMLVLMFSIIISYFYSYLFNFFHHRVQLNVPNITAQHAPTMGHVGPQKFFCLIVHHNYVARYGLALKCLKDCLEFLLGGGWYFSETVPIENAYLPSVSRICLYQCIPEWA